MFFNSIEFTIFLPIVFILYWIIDRWGIKRQNQFLLLASYLFYGWWDFRFLFLILLSTIVDFFIGILMAKSEILWKRKFLLTTSILVNIGILGFFKYSNFFIDSFLKSFSIFGGKFDAVSLDFILPVGISFYTFQTLSYTIDVFRRQIEPTHDIFAFAAFVSFFPQLVAGPIERATNLLPQFHEKRHFDYEKAVDGLRQMLWGFFKKIVIADSCAQYVDQIFNNHHIYSGSTLLLGAVLFSFQIYGDFSGYSDIAIGTSRLFGIHLMRNFNFPYFSRDIAEFWRRWHISLTTWFRDYLYIPLGGSRRPLMTQIRNIFIIFIVSGLWHGANWTFVIWGVVNAVLFLPLLILKKNRSNIEIVAKGRCLPNRKEFSMIVVTFGLTSFAWIFFRAESASHAFSYIASIFSFSLFEAPDASIIRNSFVTIILLVVFIVIEWTGREYEYAIAEMGLKWMQPYRWSVYYFMILCIIICSDNKQDFIYFQF